jgi:hypothetical protein
MRDNIARADDTVLAEAAVFALAGVMPRADAEECVKTAVGLAVSQKRPLIEAVRETTKGKIAKGKLDWRALRKKENYLGESDQLIDAVLAKAKKTFSS